MVPALFYESNSEAHRAFLHYDKNFPYSQYTPVPEPLMDRPPLSRHQGRATLESGGRQKVSAADLDFDLKSYKIWLVLSS